MEEKDREEIIGAENDSEESNAAKILKVMGDKAIKKDPVTGLSKAEEKRKKLEAAGAPEERKTQRDDVVADTYEESGSAKVVRVLSTGEEVSNDDGVVAKGNWFENFWYHHKWKTILITFFAIVIGICIYQIASKTTPDAYTLYVGPEYIDASYNQSLTEALKSICKDYNGDKKVGVQFTDIIYLNSEQVEARRKIANARGEPLVFDAEGNSSNYEQFTYEVMTGQSVIYFMDSAIYENIKGDDIFVSLAEIFGEIPDSAYDDHAILLSDTEFAKYFTAFQNLPKDTVVCIRRVLSMSYFTGRNKAEKAYENHLDFFKNIVDFKVAK